MARMSLRWTLAGSGWADCTVADDEAEAEVTASYITAAPEELLTATARLVLGEERTQAQFEAEPAAFRWIFQRSGNDVWVRLLALPDGRRHGNAGTEIWSSRQTIGTLARAVIRCFDDVARRHDDSGYHGRWKAPFPRRELEALRTAWRNHTARPLQPE